MFRLFLIDRLFSGYNTSKDEIDSLQDKVKGRKSNRRIYERFNVDNKHLTLMNDQDIFLIRDISEEGFSSEVSKRGYQRLLIGDIYKARMRYINEIFDLEIKVAWKGRGFVGFETTNANDAYKKFVSRLLEPLEIAYSLKKVKTKSIKEEAGKEWFHDNNKTNLYVWNKSDEELKAWHLEDGGNYVEWDENSGIQTGEIQTSDKVIGTNKPWESIQIKDDQTNTKQIQYAMDIFMAMQNPIKEPLLNTLLG